VRKSAMGVANRLTIRAMLRFAAKLVSEKPFHSR
jgi:hypothetical protein